MKNQVCLTCVDSTKKYMETIRKGKYKESSYITKTEGIIPPWFRRAGIYSPLAPALTCDKSLNACNHPLMAHGPRYHNDSVTIKLKSLQEIDKKLDLHKPQWFYMWAALPRHLDQTDVQDAENSYGNFSNSGLFKSEDGEVTFRFANPLPYRVDDIQYPAHIHFTRLLPDKTWELKVWTVNVAPVLEFRDVINVITNPDYTIINCLPSSKKPLGNIPNSIRISYARKVKNVKSMLLDLVGTSAEDLTMPIVLYCAGSECGASTEMEKKLMKLGYNNLLHYSGGLEDWNNQMENIQLLK